MIEVAEVFLWQGKAYVPVIGKTEVGFPWESGPVLTTDATTDALVVALDTVISQGNPPMRHPTQEEFRHPTPVQSAIGLRSWKKMARAGVIRCVIWWADDRITVAFSPRDAKDIQETDFAHQTEFDLGTPTRVLVEHILRDVDQRTAKP